MPRGRKPRSSEEPIEHRSAMSEEARENQLICLAVDLAEKQLREGTASSQVITHYLKLGSTKERIEKQILEKQKDLLEAKTQAIKATQVSDEKYDILLNALKSYSGGSEDYGGPNIF